VTDSTVLISRYCTACGSPLIDGSCPTCAQPVSLDAPSRRPSSVAVLVCLSLLLATSGLVWVGLQHRRSDQRIDALLARISSEDARATALSRRARADEAGTLALSRRLRTLEASASHQADKEPAKIADRVKKSVFTIETSTGLGSGFVVTSTGGTSTLLTNFHVVADDVVNGRRDVKVKQRDQTFEGTVTKTSATDDLALIEVSADLPVLAISETQPSVGDAVMAFGSPLGLEGTVSAGIVSAFRHQDGQRYVQFTAAISPGNSGGPVVNSDGSVIGVAEMKIVGENADALAFAIPTSTICENFTVC
jgi:putative serine protease PepD